MATQKFDKLNNISSKTRSMPFDKYFGEMKITKAQKQKRIDGANTLHQMMLGYFALIDDMEEDGYIDYAYARNYLAERYTQEAKAIDDMITNSFIVDRAQTFATQITDTTQNHSDDPYYRSDDRAKFIAEDETNTICNDAEFLQAVEDGKTKKRWNGIVDKKQRDTHRAITGKTIPIMEMFQVGDAEMLFPKDYENAGDYPEEIVNCRCSVTYM